MEATITRDIEVIRVLPLSGESHNFESIEDAINYIQSIDGDEQNGPIVRYEVQIRYDNGDEITGEFSKQKRAINFLEVTVESQSSLDQF